MVASAIQTQEENLTAHLAIAVGTPGILSVMKHCTKPCASSCSSRTSRPSPAEFAAVFRRLLDGGASHVARTVTRLRELSPLLARMLADKTLSPEALRSRKLRDAAYTLVVNAERRLRAAAEYWYAGTDKTKDYAPFPVSRGAASTGEDEGEAGAEDDGAPDEGETEGGAPDEVEQEDEAPEDVTPSEDEDER